MSTYVNCMSETPAVVDSSFAKRRPTGCSWTWPSAVIRGIVKRSVKEMPSPLVKPSNRQTFYRSSSEQHIGDVLFFLRNCGGRLFLLVLLLRCLFITQHENGSLAMFTQHMAELHSGHAHATRYQPGKKSRHCSPPFCKVCWVHREEQDWANSRPSWGIPNCVTLLTRLVISCHFCNNTITPLERPRVSASARMSTRIAPSCG